MAKARPVSLTYDSQTELYLGVKRSFPPQIYGGITDKNYVYLRYANILIPTYIVK